MKVKRLLDNQSMSLWKAHLYTKCEHCFLFTKITIFILEVAPSVAWTDLKFLHTLRSNIKAQSTMVVVMDSLPLKSTIYRSGGYNFRNDAFWCPCFKSRGQQYIISNTCCSNSLEGLKLQQPRLRHHPLGKCLRWGWWKYVWVCMDECK